MTRSQPSTGPLSAPGPRPVRLGRYRYSRLRWRLSVHVIDAVGALAMGLWRCVRPAPAAAPPRRVLVVQLDHLGDAVLTSPLLAGLRAAYPTAAIEVLASPSNHQVFESDPGVDRVHRAARTWFERRPGHWAMLSAVWSLGRALRNGGYDLGIDVRGDILTVLVLTLAGIPRRVGWAMGGGGFLLTDVARWVPGRHEVRSRLALLEQLGVVPDAPPRVLVHVSDDDRIEVNRRLLDAWPDPLVVRRASGVVTARARSEALAGRSRRRTLVPAVHALVDRLTEPDWLHAGRFGAEAPVLAVHLGAGTAAKRWPPAYWRVLLGRFLADGWRVVVVGGPDDAPAASVLDPHRDLQNWTGWLTVTQTAALLERADLFIGADSGPSHLAACAGIPSVVLFSGTNRPAQWRPWSRRSLILKHPVSCRPCHQKTCPLAGHPCMTGLHPDRVYRAARRWWARLHRQESPHVPL
jgi:ADP-heptose:LPS heptosyltransferase